MPLRIGVIGCGVHGMHHVRLLAKTDKAIFTGVYDPDPVKLQAAVQENGVRGFSSLDELIANIDAAVVAVPTSSHHDVVMQCFAAGRHVLVEKPIAVTVAEADHLVEEARRCGVVFGVGHIERFNAAFRPVAGMLNGPGFIESHRLSVFNPRGTDVAVVLDLMIHDIDLVLDLVKSPVTLVRASGVSVVSDAVDIANARIEFANGGVANLTASRISQRKMRKLRAFQKNAYVSMDFLTGETEVFSLAPGGRPAAAPGATPQLMEGISYIRHINDGGNALGLELEDFIGAIEHGTAPRVTGEAGRDALAVASRIMESIEEHARSIA